MSHTMSSEDILTIDSSTVTEDTDSSLTEVVEEVVKLEVDETKLKKVQYIYETDEDSGEDPVNEDEAFEALPARKKHVYNEMVEFQAAMRQFGLAGSLQRIIHGQQENINPPMPEEVARREMATATAVVGIIKTEEVPTSTGPIHHITPILVKQEPSETHVIQDADAFKAQLPEIPEQSFMCKKRELDNPTKSYSEYETDDSEYMADDVKIETEPDSDEAIEFVDDTLTTYNIETLDAALMKIHDGLSIATSGYEDVRQALPMMNPVEVPQILEQVPLPRIEGVTKNMKTLLEKLPEEDIIRNCILHMVDDGASILKISKETGLTYNNVHKIVYSTKRPGGTQYPKKDDQTHKRVTKHSATMSKK